MKLPRVPIQGNCQQTTIAQANIAQSLVTTRTLVRYVLVQPDPDNSGELRVSLGPSPFLPQLERDARRIPGQGGWIDLSQIQIKSTAAGDKATFQTEYAP